jgi:hypothetical protein
MTSDWDPTKWIIYILHLYTPLVPSIARTAESSITKARARVHMAEADRLFGTVKADEMVKDPSELPVWTKSEAVRKHGEWANGDRRRVLLLLEGCLVDVGGYLEDHVCPSTSITLHLIQRWVGIELINSPEEKLYSYPTASPHSQLLPRPHIQIHHQHPQKRMKEVYLIPQIPSRTEKGPDRKYENR